MITQAISLDEFSFLFFPFFFLSFPSFHPLFLFIFPSSFHVYIVIFLFGGEWKILSFPFKYNAHYTLCVCFNYSNACDLDWIKINSFSWH